MIRIPALLGSWSILLAQENVRLLFGHTAATLVSRLRKKKIEKSNVPQSLSFQVFEILIRDGAILPLKLIRNSNVIRMLTFMGISAFILDTVHVMGGRVFWIVQPFRRPATIPTNNNNNNVDEKDREICLHKNIGCKTYVMQALKNYTSIGICLEIVKALFSNFSLICQSPTVGLIRSVKRINPKFLLFVAGYPTLYRVRIFQFQPFGCIWWLISISLSRFQLTNCLLNRYFGESNRLAHATAAFIGGMPYYFFADELSILSHGIASAMELGWAHYLRSLDKSTKQYRYASAIPFSCIAYVIGGAFMYNVRVFYPWLAPKFLIRLIQLLTNHKYVSPTFI